MGGFQQLQQQQQQQQEQQEQTQETTSRKGIQTSDPALREDCFNTQTSPNATSRS